ncbi:hypothetical protein RJ640_022370, partial [Escallonia rubra]
VEVYTDFETFQLMGKEHALVICNHRSDIDWLVGWVLAQRSGCLGSALAIVKKSTKYLPVIGWSMWFSEYIFLDRSWTKDENRLKSGLQQLCDFPQPFWLALFPEGTRFTRANLVAAQEYAASAGLPVPRNVLIPRTKGFVAAVSHLRSFVPAIYNMSVDIPKSDSPPTMLRMFRRQSSVVSQQCLDNSHMDYRPFCEPKPSLRKSIPLIHAPVFHEPLTSLCSLDVLLDCEFGDWMELRLVYIELEYCTTISDRPDYIIQFSSIALVLDTKFGRSEDDFTSFLSAYKCKVHVHIKRHLMEELPETEGGIAQWCRDVFVEKDALLELHAARGTFGDKECLDIGRPKKSLFVVISWSCLLIFGAVELFRWCPFSSREIALCAVFLALVMILMQILIMSSQSENSTPPDALNQKLLQK